MRPRDIPNALCVLRMLLVAPVVWLLLAGEYAWVLVVFFLAGFTDGLDGFLAKRFDWRSRLGGILDPLADKLLLVTSFLTLGYIGLAPVWLLIMVVARDVIIVSGATAYRFLIGVFQASPTLVSKANSALQLLYVLAAVADAGFGIPGRPVVNVIGYAVLATTVVSGIDYMVTWGLRAWRVRHPT
ncbi:MAG: CDP-alcohol phosphatidyltransferase family protein [Gammaproteobacteria bacterium]